MNTIVITYNFKILYVRIVILLNERDEIDHN